jgi:hypothetical protein
VTAHTPGPWRAKPPRVNERDPVFHHCDVIAGGIRVAVVAGVGVEQAHANAEIVAAAPATAALLERALDALAELFKQCAMIHKYGGEIDNTKEANAAVVAGHAILKEAGRV